MCPVNTRKYSNLKTLSFSTRLHNFFPVYMFGVGGSKPAKEYTPQESHAVKNKDKYNMRKQFWLKCAENTEMVHAG